MMELFFFCVLIIQFRYEFYWESIEKKLIKSLSVHATCWAPLANIGCRHWWRLLFPSTTVVLWNFAGIRRIFLSYCLVCQRSWCVVCSWKSIGRSDRFVAVRHSSDEVDCICHTCKRFQNLSSAFPFVVLTHLPLAYNQCTNGLLAPRVEL